MKTSLMKIAGALISWLLVVSVVDPSAAIAKDSAPESPETKPAQVKVAQGKTVSINSDTKRLAKVPLVKTSSTQGKKRSGSLSSKWSGSVDGVTVRTTTSGAKSKKLTWSAQMLGTAESVTVAGQGPVMWVKPATKKKKKYSIKLDLKFTANNKVTGFSSIDITKVTPVVLTGCSSVADPLSCTGSKVLSSVKRDKTKKTIQGTLAIKTASQALIAFVTPASTPEPTPSEPSTDPSTSPEPSPSSEADSELENDLMLAPLSASQSTGSRGDFTATPLSALPQWSAGQQSGDFSWSYPIEAPPASGGLVPQVALEYNSGVVDGLTSAANAQTSWIGEGFNLSPGFVERTYEPCGFVSGSGSNAPSNSGDLCWRDDNLTLSFGGRTSPLVRIGSTDEWRMKNDDGTRVERKKQTGINADNDGEYWVVTTVDGTRYYFGRNQRFEGDSRETNSVSAVAVYGSKAGEPCHDDAFGSSSCSQAWRWALDYVLDPHGNTISYFYNQEKNKYGANRNASVKTYDRASYLTSIEYGSRFGDDDAQARIIFTVAERCVEDGSFDCTEYSYENSYHWPDVPAESVCTGDSCQGQISPTFFTRKRLAKITTEVKDGGSFSAVNEWKLSHTYPVTGDTNNNVIPGDGYVRVMWLNSIQQTGKAGSDIELPATVFHGMLLDNRVDKISDNIDPFARFRLTAIVNGYGGVTSINYSKADCTTSNKPSSSALDANNRRCFPVWYQPEWATSPQLEFFHKYRVDAVTEADQTTPALGKVTSYSYTDGAGWHYNDNPTIRSKYRTWNEWRGYARVTTEVGSQYAKTYTDSLYYRGMHGDKKQAGGTKSVNVTDGLGYAANTVDAEEFRGFERRVVTKLGASGAVVDYTVNTPWASAATATQGALTAKIVKLGSTETKTALAAGGYRTTKVDYTYDEHGLPTKVADAGDTSITTDDQCTLITYAKNTTDWLLDFPAIQTTIGKTCGTAAANADDVISATRVSYDGGAVGAAPSKGNVTKQESASGFASGAISYQTDATYSYDSLGRVVSQKDALDNEMTTSFSPSTGFATEIAVTNALGQTTTTTMNRQWGSATKIVDTAGKHTDITYDSLGRVTAVWKPGREKSSGKSAVEKYSYLVRADKPSVVTVEKLNSFENYVKIVNFFDGFMRERGSQSPAAGAHTNSRMITETRYNERGEVERMYQSYPATGTVSTDFVYAADNQVDAYHVYTYDQAGRIVQDDLRSKADLRSSTKYSYGGDRVNVTPPVGGTATTTVTDARGQTTSLMQYLAATPTGTAETTTYAYTPRGEIKTITDPMGIKWSREYDIRGRLTKETDPDKGITTYTYDALDRQVTSKDARNATLWTGYDALGRKTELRDDTATGTKRAAWVYDTVRPGSLTSKIRYEGSNEYKTVYETYNAAGQPTKWREYIPASEGLLSRASGYTFTQQYYADGSLKETVEPVLMGMVGEKLAYDYDHLNNMILFAGRDSFANEVELDAWGRATRISAGNWTEGIDTVLTNQYDNATGRLVNRRMSTELGWLQPVVDLYYTYDQAGNVTKLNDVVGGDTNQTSASTWRQCFKYDHVQRLTGAWTSSGNMCAAATDANLGTLNPYWDTFTYDKSGNRTKLVTKSKPASTLLTQTVTQVYPAVTAARPHGVTTVTRTGASPGTETFAYDATGNVTGRGANASSGTNWTYDAEGNLTTVTNRATGKKTEFVYDADGNRLIKRDEAANTSTLYLGSAEVVLSGSTLTTSRYYSFAGVPIAVRTSDKPLSIVVADLHGSPVAMVDNATGAVTKRRTRPFGEPLATVGAWTGSRGFVNQPVDESMGTTHLGAREYDPTLGRFMSVDPIMDPLDPQQLNGFAYANNSPITVSDADGLRTTCGIGVECGEGRLKQLHGAWICWLDHQCLV